MICEAHDRYGEPVEFILWHGYSPHVILGNKEAYVNQIRANIHLCRRNYQAVNELVETSSPKLGWEPPWASLRCKM